MRRETVPRDGGTVSHLAEIILESLSVFYLHASTADSLWARNACVHRGIAPLEKESIDGHKLVMRQRATSDEYSRNGIDVHVLGSNEDKGLPIWDWTDDCWRVRGKSRRR